MAPIKFEENIQEKLEGRTLSPSESSWGKLAKRLDDEKINKKSTNLWWLGIAAGIVVLISTGIFFFDNNSIFNNAEEIVNKDLEVDMPKKNNEQMEKLELVQSIPEKIEVENNKPQNATLSKTVDPIILKPKFNLQETAAVAIVTESEKDVSLLPNLIKKETFEEITIKEVVTEISKLNDKDQVDFDNKVDSLLKAAQREILTGKLNINTRTVDADALLQDVEAELDQSFRTKVFDALKNGYESVKTAVAERNN